MSRLKEVEHTTGVHALDVICDECPVLVFVYTKHHGYDSDEPISDKEKNDAEHYFNAWHAKHDKVGHTGKMHVFKK